MLEVEGKGKLRGDRLSSKMTESVQVCLATKRSFLVSLSRVQIPDVLKNSKKKWIALSDPRVPDSRQGVILHNDCSLFWVAVNTLLLVCSPDRFSIIASQK